MAGKTKVKVKKLPEGFAVQGEAGNFRIVLDESPATGGTDAGMNPMQALLCAMGACQSMVAMFYAKNYKVNLSEFYIELEGMTDPLMEPRHTGLREISYSMHFNTDADQETMERFADFIEKRCPVANSLKHEVKLVRTGVFIEK